MKALDAEASDVGSSRRREVGALKDLFELFTRGRRNVRRFAYLDDPRLRAAYLRYHVPLNVARATCVLRHVRSLCSELMCLRDVVDLGAGPGSASIASLLDLPDPATLRLRLYDRSKSALSIASRLLERLGAQAAGEGEGAEGVSLDVRATVSTLPSLPAIERPSLVWFAMVLNELGVGERGGVDAEEFVRHVTRKVPAGSVLLVIEPALRAPGRSLLRLHDAAIDAGGWRVVAPCTHQRRCPLLRATGRPWCHVHFEWNAPREVREIARPLGLDTRKVSLAYLALARETSPWQHPAPADDPRTARVIGDPMPIRGGRVGVYVCAGGERRLEPINRTQLFRGDIVRLERRSPRRRVEVLRRWREGGRRRASKSPDEAE